MTAAAEAAGLAFQGNPDWRETIATENFLLLPAYGDPAIYFALPRCATLARRPTGLPDFFLEFVSDRNGAKPEESLYATLSMGLERASDLAPAYSKAAKVRAGATLMPVTFTAGTYWHIECPGAKVRGPFAWEDARRATIYGRIPPDAANAIYQSIEAGSLSAARAALECELNAFLPRVEAAVTFRPASLIAALSALNSGAPAVAFQRMISFLDDPPSGLFRYEGEDGKTPGRGLALAGRVRERFGSAAPCLNISEGPFISLCLPSASPDEERWDLGTPAMTGVPVFLDFDPFTSIVKNGERDKVTAFTRVPPLPLDGRTERVTIASGIPRNIRNCDEIDLLLRVDKAYSRSGSTAAESVALYPSFTQTAPVELAYKKSGPKPYSTRLTVILDGEQVEMPWVETSGDYQFIGADRLPGQCVRVLAMPDLLAQADINVSVRGVPGLSAGLSPLQTAASFLLSADTSKVRLAIDATDREKTAPALSLDLPCGSVTLDPASFAEYGPKTATVAIDFQDDVEAVRLEFLPESGAEAPLELGFSTKRPGGEFSYLPSNLFRIRYRFRVARDDGFDGDDSAAPWSEFQNPGRRLRIVADRGGSRIASPESGGNKHV